MKKYYPSCLARFHAAVGSARTSVFLENSTALSTAIKRAKRASVWLALAVVQWGEG